MTPQYFVMVLLLVSVQGAHCKDWQSTKKTALARNLYLLNNSVMSDIKFTFEESKRKWFYAHKHILATRSPVFYNMFYFFEAINSKTVSVIHLPGTDEKSVMEFLRFLYTDECRLTPKIALKVTKLATRYAIPALEAKCVEVLQVNTTVENAFALLEQTEHLETEELYERCWDVIDRQTNKALASENFASISRTTLIQLLKRDTLRIGEVELFQAVLRWADYQCLKKELNNSPKNRRLVLGDAIYELRFLLMTQEEFAQNVPPTGLLTNDEIVPIYQKLMGLNSQNLKWNITETRSDYVRFPRFSQSDIKPPDTGWFAYLFPSLFSKNSDNNWWYYWTGKPASLCFSVNKAAILYGIRLFGDGKSGAFEVKVEVKGVQLSATYTSEFVIPASHPQLDRVELYNFDVVFPNAILIKPYEDIDLSVYVWGPKSFFGINEKASVTNRDLTVFFGDKKSYFYTKHRQIYEIILIPVKKQFTQS